MRLMDFADRTTGRAIELELRRTKTLLLIVIVIVAVVNFFNFIFSTWPCFVTLVI